MVAKILVKAEPTRGDSEFFDRWTKLGEVFSHGNNEEVDVLVVDQWTNVDDAMLEQFPNLRFIASANTAHTHLTYDSTQKEIVVLSLRGETGFLETIFSTIEHTIYLMARLAKEIDPPVLLKNKGLAVIGFGRVGSRVATIAKGMGMDPKWMIDKHSTPEQWRDAFGLADFVSLHLSEEPGTHKIVNGDLLRLMKPTSFLVNTSRPSVVEEMVLWSMLRDGVIKGAGLDTFDYGPLDALNNTITTDHQAGRSLEDRVKTDTFIVQKTRSALLRAGYQLPSSSHANLQ